VGLARKIFKKKLLLSLFVVQFIIVLTGLGYRAWTGSSVECVRCHADREKLAELGYPELYVTTEAAQRESSHPNTACRDCHLGNGRAKDKAKAHQGMLKALIIGYRGKPLPRGEITKQAILPSGDDGIRELLPKYEGTAEVHPAVRNLLWHDRNPETLNFGPDIAKKTCGKSGCHPEELKQFRTTNMGRNYRQRTMKTWREPYGPHNCGPSFADTPPEEVLGKSGFDYANTKKIGDELNLKFTPREARAKQRFCNVCHAGCLDCHYVPGKKEGVHNFDRVPKSPSCMGSGRGTSICHPGSMHSRRGETYIGGDYSMPEGMEPDVHYTKNIHCIDCHQTGPKGMGDMERKATCQDCHIEAEEAHAKSVHRDMDCASCHISRLGGYQITIWGLGRVAGGENPFMKYGLYYGIQGPPILMKDESGKWMPIKVWPHSLGNFKTDVPPSGKILFRWAKGETRDGYYVIGAVDGLPSGNKHLLWLELEQAAHPFGKARKCASCHKNGGREQVSVSNWEFVEEQGVLAPFKGTHRIVADKEGIRIEGLTNTSPIKPGQGSRLTDFASWVYMKDKWRAPGDFSIKTDPVKYKKALKLSSEAERELKALEKASKNFDGKTLRRFKELKESVLHNEEDALRLIRAFKE